MPDTLYEAMQGALEPLAMTDGPTMKLAQLDLRARLSQAISLKRIAEALERSNEIAEVVAGLSTPNKGMPPPKPLLS